MYGQGQANTGVWILLNIEIAILFSGPGLRRYVLEHDPFVRMRRIVSVLSERRSGGDEAASAGPDAVVWSTGYFCVCEDTRTV